MRCTLHPIRLPYRREVRWSDIVESSADYLLLEIVDADGAVGIAEATVKPTWSGVTLRSLAAILEDLFLPRLAAIDAGDTAGVAAMLASVPDNLAAKALVDAACHDLRAARGPLRDAVAVPVSWTLTRDAPAAMAREAAERVAAEGYSTLKMKGGQGVATDLAALDAIRAAVGDRVRLYVDANGAYPVAQAIDYARALADRGCFLVEDPCALAPDESLRALQASVAVPILVDFATQGLRDVAPFRAFGARAFSVKPGRIGPSAARAMVDAAGEFVVGLWGESALGTLATLDFAAHAGPALAPAESTFFVTLREQVVSAPLRIGDGRVELPARRGNAAFVDRDALARFRVG